MQYLLLCGNSYRFPIAIPRYQAGYLRVTTVRNSSGKSKILPSAFYLHVLGIAASVHPIALNSLK